MDLEDAPDPVDQYESIHASFPWGFPWVFCWGNQNPASGSCAEAVPGPGIQTHQLDLHISHTELAVCGQQWNLNQLKMQKQNKNYQFQHTHTNSSFGTKEKISPNNEMGKVFKSHFGNQNM